MSAPGIFYSVLTAVWMIVLGWAIWPIEPPIKYTGGDSVTPAVVKQGGTITITRRFIVLREEPIVILRTLIRGNCKLDCETADLPDSNISLSAQESRNQTRDIVLPGTVEPGEWRAVFVAQWRDKIGWAHRLPLKELPFTVVP